MTTSSTNALKKDTPETKPTQAQANDANENVDAKLEEGQAKEAGKHGQDFCCGSCS